MFHVREIPECLDSYKALPIDTAYFTGFTEKQLEKPVNEFIQTTSYDYYWICSDDVIANRPAFDLIERGLSKHDIVTGYDFNPDGSGNLCLCDKPLLARFPTGLKDYPWMSGAYFDAYPGEYVPTTYVPFIFSAIKRDVWLEVPYATYSVLPAWFSQFFLTAKGSYWRMTRPIRGWANDYNFSYKLQKKGIKAYAVKGARMEHLGSSVFRPVAYHLNLGEVKPSVELVRCAS